MRIHAVMLAAAAAAVILAGGFAPAGEEAESEMDRLKRDTKVLRRELARESREAADGVKDFGHRLADNVKDAYDGVKREAQEKLP